MKKMILILSTLVMFNSYAGNEKGNGGDRVTLEFKSFAKVLVENLPRLKTLREAGIDSDALKLIVDNAQVESTNEKLVAGGLEVDALNFPEQPPQKIIVNRDRWGAIFQEEKNQSKFALVLHEYLSLMGKNDKSYQISGPVLQELIELKLSLSPDFNYSCVIQRYHYSGNAGFEVLAVLDTFNGNSYPSSNYLYQRDIFHKKELNEYFVNIQTYEGGAKNKSAGLLYSIFKDEGHDARKRETIVDAQPVPFPSGDKTTVRLLNSDHFSDKNSFLEMVCYRGKK
ncbi:MAG: hypothetical protein PHY93_03955 [Bacteriovorax sp.]|nr:hypothetical protein [Bacteriovorax sp.]